MAKPDDKPSSFKEWVQQAIPGATASETREALAKAAPSGMKDAFAEMARRFQRPFQEEQDPPAAAPEALTSEPSSEPSPSLEPSTQETPSPEASTPEASTISAAPAPLPTRRPRRGEQEKRAERILRRDYPDGKTPASLSASAGAEQINKGLAAEKCADQAPDDELGLPDVSDDTAGRTMNKLGRT
jgi:hypothetical protein